MVRPSEEHPLPWRFAHAVIHGAEVGSQFAIYAANDVEIARVSERRTAEFLCIMANIADSMISEYEVVRVARPG